MLCGLHGLAAAVVAVVAAHRREELLERPADRRQGDDRLLTPFFPRRAGVLVFVFAACSCFRRRCSRARNPYASITRHAWWWTPRHERPSWWSRPSSSFIC